MTKYRKLLFAIIIASLFELLMSIVIILHLYQHRDHLVSQRQRSLNQYILQRRLIQKDRAYQQLIQDVRQKISPIAHNNHLSSLQQIIKCINDSRAQILHIQPVLKHNNNIDIDMYAYKIELQLSFAQSLNILYQLSKSSLLITIPILKMSVNPNNQLICTVILEVLDVKV